LLCLLAWGYLLLVTAAMGRGDMSLMGLPAMSVDRAIAMSPVPWTARTFVLMLVMWWIMMVGMMIPSALPMILLHDRLQRHYAGSAAAFRLTALFSLGYLIAWGGFSLVATALQWGLHSSGLLAPMSLSVGAKFGALLFIAAGIYQLSPLKNVCLRHCRSPAEFLVEHRRPGTLGALLSGGHHGLYCVGCCWLLMLLLFAVGVMNLVWVAALAVLILIEKVAPRAEWVTRASGLLLLAAAAWLAFAGS
jgi:predicted metal-binding membrane protein